MTLRQIWLIADDYGLSPGVNEAILKLLHSKRLSGTGCMTTFSEWPQVAKHLQDVPEDAAIGLHLTLTDQVAATGESALAPKGILPSLPQLALKGLTSSIMLQAAHQELDLQYLRFVEAMGRAPDYIDGHQHVHFLPVVRQWLTSLRQKSKGEALPFLRGAPKVSHAPSVVRIKAGVAALLASGFDEQAKQIGFAIKGPLAGFYKWNDQKAFAAALKQGFRSLPDDALFMCHPGFCDDILESRDKLLAPREVEFNFLSSDTFADLLAQNDVSLARIVR